jgi:hypothetical protein
MTPNQPEDDFDMTQFPAIFSAVLDLMPTREMWVARFSEQPGGTTVQPDADDWLTVRHRGDVVMKISVGSFRRGAILGDAQIMVDGHWQNVGVEWGGTTGEAGQ